MIDGITAKGFKFTLGYEGSGLFILGMLRGGGYYIGKLLTIHLILDPCTDNDIFKTWA